MTAVLPAENAALVGVPTTGWVDALLDRLPARPAELAPPPAGSGLAPVRGDRGLPVLGHGLHTVRYGPAFQMELARRHGPVSWWTAFGRRIVAVCGPEAAQEVLTTRSRDFTTGWPDIIGPWFDGGLLGMHEPEHRTDRRMMQAAYGERALEGYLGAMVADVEDVTATWPHDRRFRVVPALRELSGQTTIRAFLGVAWEDGGREVMRDVEACIRAETALLRASLPGTTWRRAHRARRRLRERIAAALPGARARDGADFLSVASRVTGLDDGTAVSRLIDHTIFTLIAAHDTTTTAIYAAVYFLGRHPEWQRRARAEVLAGADPLGLADLDALTVLDRVVRESIRLVSPTPVIARRAVADTEVAGHFVPAGSMVAVYTSVNQLLPEFWSDPSRFDPDRFAPGRAEDRGHRLAWAPFGAGGHKCVGMRLGMAKVKATLAALLRSHAWELPASYETRWSFASLPAPADGLPLVLRPAAGA